MGKSLFKNRRYVIEYLSDALSKRRLAIFLGAGVSRELINTGSTAIGLPSWRELLVRLYQGQGWKCPSGSNYTRVAEDFKNRFIRSGKTIVQFIPIVQEALYRGIRLDFATIRQNATLAGLGALISHSRRGQVTEIFTLNFDDVVERYLGYHGIIAKPIINQLFWAEPADVVIHHPHGFLPSPRSQFSTSSTFLVFDERSYVEDDPNSRWNQRMEVAMQANICLFVGLGRDDIHLKRLVAHTRGRHAFNPARDGYWGVVFRASPSKDEIDDWGQYDVHVEPVADYEKDLPGALFAICQEAAKHP